MNVFEEGDRVEILLDDRPQNIGEEGEVLKCFKVKGYSFAQVKLDNGNVVLVPTKYLMIL